jgi:hypothetical protein
MGCVRRGLTEGRLCDHPLLLRQLGKENVRYAFYPNPFAKSSAEPADFERLSHVSLRHMSPYYLLVARHDHLCLWLIRTVPSTAYGSKRR